jgi:DNA-directed RNA polymerase subunit RPC12/RpoP
MKELECPDCKSNVFIRHYEEIWKVNIKYDEDSTQDDMIEETELIIDYKCANCWRHFTEEEIDKLTGFGEHSEIKEIKDN